MAKAKPEWERKLMQNKWIFFALAVAFLAIGYGLVSWAINTGSFWQYVLGILFLMWGLRGIYRSIRNLRNH